MITVEGLRLRWRRESPRRREGALAIVAMISAAAAVASCGGDSTPSASRAAKSSPAATATSAKGAFVSSTLPYQLALPAGWLVFGADEFSDAKRTQHLIVGHGFPKPGETVSDRVRAERAGETRHGGCTSDPKQDRPIKVGGERGTLWSYTCAPDDSHVIPASDAYYLSAQTIHRRPGHRRVGYRFTVVVPRSEKGQAKPLLDRFLAGLTFLTDSDATADG